MLLIAGRYFLAKYRKNSDQQGRFRLGIYNIDTRRGLETGEDYLEANCRVYQ